MKKTYIAPKAQMIELDCDALMDITSPVLPIDDEVGNGDIKESLNRVILWGDDEE